jgi:hypothetical protein
VFEVEASVRAVAAAAKELGGFMTQQSNVSITVRVPAANFEDAVRRVEKIGDVTGRQIRADDVTQEFMDLDIRLKNLRAVRERLADLLSRATKVEDSLKIEHELERVAQEVDRIEGRLKYLRDQIAFSTVTVTFTPRREEAVAQGAFRLPFPWLDRLGLARLLNVGGGQPR